MINMLLTLLSWLWRIITGKPTAEAIEHGRTLERYESAAAIMAASQGAKNVENRMRDMDQDQRLRLNDELNRLPRKPANDSHQ